MRYWRTWVITGFYWIATQADNPDGCTFYLDDIKYRYNDKNFSIYTDINTGWAGIYWQYPEHNWGNKEGGFNLTGATKLIFWAKGDGCENTRFMMGGVSGDTSSDTDNASIDIDLTDVWKKYVINLTGKSLKNIITGFGFVTSQSDDPDGCRVYIDEIRYENVSMEVGVSNNTEKGEWIAETYNSVKHHPNIKMICYFNVDKGGTKYLTGESDWAVYTTPRDNRNNIDDCSFDPNKRIPHYNESVKNDHYIYRFPLYLQKGDFNGNGRVDIGDVAKVAFMVAGKVPEDMDADFNGNGRVDIGDAAKIAFYLAGKVSEL